MADQEPPGEGQGPVNSSGNPTPPTAATAVSPVAVCVLKADKVDNPVAEDKDHIENTGGIENHADDPASSDLEEEPKLYIAEDIEIGESNGNCEKQTASENSEKASIETSENPSKETPQNTSSNDNFDNPSVKETPKNPTISETSKSQIIQNSDIVSILDTIENPSGKSSEIPLFGDKNSELPSAVEHSEKPFLDKRSDTGSFEVVGEHSENPSSNKSSERSLSEDVKSDRPIENTDQNGELSVRTFESAHNNVKSNEDPASQQSSHDRKGDDENSFKPGDQGTDSSNTVLEVDREVNKPSETETVTQNNEQIQETEEKAIEEKSMESPPSMSNSEPWHKPAHNPDESNQTTPKPEQIIAQTVNIEQSTKPASNPIPSSEPAANTKQMHEPANDTEQSHTPTSIPTQNEPAARSEPAITTEQTAKPTASPGMSGPFDWSSIGLYRCPNCKFTVDDEQLFKNHVTTCTKVNQGQVLLSCSIGIPMSYTCDTCAISWINKAEFEEHVVCHIVDSPYLCITCRRNFHSRYAIEKHAKTDHPNGDSRCALRGMKKCREFVKSVEISGKCLFEGKLQIPRTPRNQIKGTADDVDGETNTPVATMPSPRPNIGKFMNSNVTSMNPQVQSRSEIVTLATASSAGLTSVSVGQFITKPSTIEYRPPISHQANDGNSMFKVMASQSGTFQPLTLPSKLQRLVNVTSANTEAKPRTDLPPPPPYHVKHFTEFTQASTPTLAHFTQAVSQTTNSATAVTTLSSTPVWLIPVGPPMPMSQATLQTSANTVNAAPVVQTSQPFQQTGQVRQTSMMINAQPSNQFVILTPGSGSKSLLNSQPGTTFPSPPALKVPAMPVPRSTIPSKLPGSAAPPRLMIPTNQTTATISARLPWNNSPGINMSPPALKPGYPTKTPAQPSSTNQGHKIPAMKQFSPTFGQSLNSPNTSLTSTAPTNVITIPSTSSNDLKHQNEEKKAIDKTYTFRIKPQKGFVCESCRKFTRDELVFRKHVWDHFHIGISSCKYCKKDDKLDAIKKGVLNCQLVNDIVCKLVKNTVKMQNTNETIVIDITDEDDKEQSKKRDRRAKSSESQAIEVIVVDDDETENDSLNIKITSSYSLHDPETEFENMSKEATEKPKEREKDVIEVEDTDKKMDVGSSDVLVLDDDDDNDNVGNDDDHHEEDNVDVETSNDKEAGKPEKESVNKSSPEPPRSSFNDLVSDKIDQIFSKDLQQSGDSTSQKVKSKKSKKSKKEVLQIGQGETGHDANHVADSTTSTSENTRENTPTVLTQKDMFEAEVISALGYLAFYMCGYEQCSFSCLTSLGYREHLQSQHLNSLSNYVCCHCGRKDYNDESHMRHMYAHSSASTKAFYLYKCPVRQCKYKTNLTQMYKEHIKKHDDLTIKCFYCHKIFSTIDSLLKHLGQNLLKFINCPYCSFKFMQRDVVVNHIKMFHPDKIRMITVSSQIVCQDREINFYVEPLAKQQNAVKDAEKDLPSTDIVSITKLLDEVKQTDQEPVDEDNEAMDVDLVSDSESTKTSSTTAEPSKQETGPPAITPVKTGTKVSTKPKHKPSLGGPKSLRCPICSYLSYNMPLHVQHVSLHENEPERDKRYVCHLCPKGSDSINHFKKHVENHIGTNELKIFNCTLCTYSSNQKCHIMDHCSDNHGGKGMYVQNIHTVTSKEDTCRYCDFKSRTLDQVLQHEEHVHKVSARENTDKPPVLEKQTSGSPKAQGESGKRKKYHCQYCQNFFKHKIDLKGHLENEHMDIENKEFAFYKCKYCSHTSTMKDFIVAHIGKAHPDSEMRILRKIESIESKKAPEARQEERENAQFADNDPPEDTSIEKEKVGIPDGNMFKQPFKCPKCSFSNNLRIAVMRHIKTHPELAPVREVTLNKAKKSTARKSTGISQDFPARKHGALYQDVPKSQLKNPFTSLKNTDDQTAEAEKESYILGENGLHSKLSACFIPLEKDVWFRCRICSQKIAKKFVLHRHILDHLNIVLFKCRYCSEGTIDKSLLFGHIQREHPQQSLAYTKVSKTELDSQFKEKIFGQDFNDTISMDDMAERSGSPIEPTGIITKSVNEQKKEPASVPAESKTDKDYLSMQILKVSDAHGKSFKCPHCNYSARRKDYMMRHLESHSDPTKDCVCQDCSFIGNRFNVLKHCYKIHGTARIGERNVSALKETVEENKSDMKSDKKPIIKDEAKTNSSKESPTISSVDESESIKDTADDSQEKEDAKDHYMKTMYKCFECGITREGVSSMYHHFKVTKKCNRPIFKCSLCAFKSATKIDITRHSKVRHPGKHFVIIPLTMKAKMKLIRIPIKYKGSKAGSEPPPSEAGSSSSRASSVTKSEDTGIRCGLCKFDSDTVMGLQFHINTRHGGKQLYCQECSYKTPLVKHMINHCKNVHRQNKAIYKQEPKVSRVKASSLDDDSSSVASSSMTRTSGTKPSAKQFHCLKCDYKTDVGHYLRRHIYIHFTYRPYQCKFCDAGRYEKGCLRKHFKKVHPNKPVFQYKYVKDEAAEAKIDKLYRKAIKRKKLEDMSTGASRPSRIDKFPLVEEGIRKEDGSSYYCDFCGHKSGKKNHIRRHYQRKHASNVASSKKRARESDDSIVGSPARKVPKIEVKDQLDVLTSESEDEESSSSKLRYSVVIGSDGQKKYKCPKCDFQTVKRSSLTSHSLVHGARLFKCFHCDFSTKLMSNGYRHVKNLHPGHELKLFNKQTGKVVYKKNLQGDHSPARSVKEETSVDESPPFRPRKVIGVLKYCCNVCNEKIEGMLPFRQHLATHPSHFKHIVLGKGTTYRLSCGYCSYMAIDESDYFSHKATHYGDRRFRCSLCEYTAFIRSGVVKHMRNLHVDKPETVIDREEKHYVSSKLVDLEPKLVLEQVEEGDKEEHVQMKCKRIRTNSEASLVDSVEESVSGPKKLFNEVVGYQEKAPVEDDDDDGDGSFHSIEDSDEMETATCDTENVKQDNDETADSISMKEKAARVTGDRADIAIDKNPDKITEETPDKLIEAKPDNVTKESRYNTTDSSLEMVTEVIPEIVTSETSKTVSAKSADNMTTESQDTSGRISDIVTEDTFVNAIEKSQDTVEEKSDIVVEKGKDNFTEQEGSQMHDSGIGDTASEKLGQKVSNSKGEDNSEAEGIAIDSLDSVCKKPDSECENSEKEILDSNEDSSLGNTSNLKQEDTSSSGLKLEECADAHFSDFKQNLYNKTETKEEGLKAVKTNDNLKDECLKTDKDEAELKTDETSVSDINEHSKMSVEETGNDDFEAENEDCEAENEDCETKDQQPGSVPTETQAFESSEDMSFDHQSSQGFEMGSQNFLVVDTYEAAGQDSSSSDKENMEQESIDSIEPDETGQGSS